MKSLPYKVRYSCDYCAAEHLTQTQYFDDYVEARQFALKVKGDLFIKETIRTDKGDFSLWLKR